MCLLSLFLWFLLHFLIIVVCTRTHTAVQLFCFPHGICFCIFSICAGTLTSAQSNPNETNNCSACHVFVSCVLISYCVYHLSVICNSSTFRFTFNCKYVQNTNLNVNRRWSHCGSFTVVRFNIESYPSQFYSTTQGTEETTGKFKQLGRFLTKLPVKLFRCQPQRRCLYKFVAAGDSCDSRGTVGIGHEGKAERDERSGI